MPDQLLIGRIRQDEAMFRAVKQCRETRRLEEHLLQSTNLHVGVDRRFVAPVRHFPIYREAGYLVDSITRKSLGQFDLDKITAPERD